MINFNIGEWEETRLDVLMRRLVFPLAAYVKENGFLGIVSYDEYEDDLFIASKSTTDSRYAEWLKEMLYKQVTPENLDKMKEYSRENNVSFVFECVDMEHDPHIIEYSGNKLTLLDIVHNEMGFVKYGYDEMCDVADRFSLAHKEKAYEIATRQELFDWYYAVLEDEYEYNGRKIEGFVIEDSVGYMTKLKLAYYNFWKFMRTVFHEVRKKGVISNTAVLTTPLANEFYGWIKALYEAGEMNSMQWDICALRREFYEDKVNTLYKKGSSF